MSSPFEKRIAKVAARVAARIPKVAPDINPLEPIDVSGNPNLVEQAEIVRHHRRVRSTRPIIYHPLLSAFIGDGEWPEF